MVRAIMIVVAVGLFIQVSGQQQPVTTNFTRYADFHIHPTYKHYFRPKTARQMQKILANTRYDSQRDIIIFSNQEIIEEFKNENWKANKNAKKNHLRKGITSNLRNYDQSGYQELTFIPGSILCNSYSPYEKQFALKLFKRIASWLLVTKMGLRRLNTYGKQEHTPFNDFLAEYFFNFMQDEKKLVKLKYQDSTDGNEVLFYNRITMVKNGEDLKEILEQNEVIFSHLSEYKDPPTIVTPLLMSIEGAQVLYGTFSARKENMMEPLLGAKACPISQEPLFLPPEIDSVRKKVNRELIENVDSLKNLHHRLFFITLGHFAQNHISGFAKTLDRDPENFQHRALSTFTKLPSIRNDLLYKTYAGLNEVDSIGFKVVKEFINPYKSRFRKPTYIDVKHMDIKARIQYYYMRRKYQQEFKLKTLPIIASHFGVSGESQAMAAATGLWPNFDRYDEVENVRKFYDDRILFGNDTVERQDYWECGMMQATRYPDRDSCPLTPFERTLYKPLDFLTDTTVNPFNPFTDYDLKANKDAGWFYPWSINLFDEEIIEINKSDGIIGLLLDPRQLGSFMKNYLNHRPGHKVKVESCMNLLTEDQLKPFGLSKSDLSYLDYLQAEPLVRNMFYIVRVVQRQQLAESYYWDSVDRNLVKTRLRYKGYIEDTLRCQKDPWEFIAVGSDYDGLIDPINLAPTASYIPTLHRKLGVYAYVFSQINFGEYYDPETRLPLIKNLNDSFAKMQKFFYENGKNFILKYF